MFHQDKTFIIAEIGNNHNGILAEAVALVDAAISSGANAVKFQVFRGRDIVAPNVLSSTYPAWGVTNHKYWIDFLDSISLTFEEIDEIYNYCRKKDILAFSTPTSIESLDFLESIGNPIYKVASMDVTNHMLLSSIAKTNKPVIMSTGMSSVSEIEKAQKILGDSLIGLLHCVSDYPLESENSNLATLDEFLRGTDKIVGFSDHSRDNHLAMLAVAKGARIIEKHITLNRETDKIAEHHFALEPEEFKDLVEKIRWTEMVNGKPYRRSEGESKLKSQARRGLHLKYDVPSGTMITDHHLAVVRPIIGDSHPEYYEQIIGKKTKRHVKAWSGISPNDVSH